MNNYKKWTALLLLTTSLAACTHPDNSTYGALEAGQVKSVQFGTVVGSRTIDIHGLNSGGGAAVGGLGGAVAGASIGGNGVGVLAGLLVGGLLGAGAEQLAQNRGGYEYTVTLETGQTVTTAQNAGDDPMIEPGTRVMVQFGAPVCVRFNCTTYNRVIPATNLPTAIARPKNIKVYDEGQEVKFKQHKPKGKTVYTAPIGPTQEGTPLPSETIQ